MTKNGLKPVHHVHQWLLISWVMWLIYRLFLVAIIAHYVLISKPSILGGVFWQGLWLLPAIISTPFIVRGKSPYALLLISILMLIYFGGSGMLTLKFIWLQTLSMSAIWAVDFILLILINVFLFILLKRLPKMNG